MEINSIRLAGAMLSHAHFKCNLLSSTMHLLTCGFDQRLLHINEQFQNSKYGDSPNWPRHSSVAYKLSFVQISRQQTPPPIPFRATQFTFHVITSIAFAFYIIKSIENRNSNSQRNVWHTQWALNISRTNYFRDRKEQCASADIECKSS